MKPTDRRHSKNANLRKQIDEIQQASELLQRLPQEIQSQTIASARSSQMANLPNSELSRLLSNYLREQRVALREIHEVIEGPRRVTSSMISKDELNALGIPSN